MRFRMIWTPLLVFALAFGLFHGPVLAQQDDPQTTIPGQEDPQYHVLTTEMGGPTGDTGEVYRIIATEAVLAEASFEDTAHNMEFDRSVFTVPAGTQVVIQFNNQEQLPHNISIYESSDAQTVLFEGEVITGLETITYEFTAPLEPGDYYFQCDVHPFMNGDFIVEEN